MILFTLFFLLSMKATALENLEDLKSKVMNDIKMTDFESFEKKWHLVTVRYRKDTSEMRWTFANEIAWKTLSSGSIEYPEGSVFGKIGAATHEDSQFPSSAVPSGARRYQFMVRNSTKYAKTGGWGYALFDVDGKVFPDPIEETSMACYACHRIVENRGQVFSQPFLFSHGSKALIETTFLSENKGFRTIEFAWTKVADLPELLKKNLSKNVGRVRSVKDLTIKKNIFQGTLDEIRPRLEIEAFQYDSPAVLVSTDGRKFSVIVPTDKEGCKKKRSFKAISTTGSLQTSSKKDVVPGIAVREYCNP